MPPPASRTPPSWEVTSYSREQRARTRDGEPVPTGTHEVVVMIIDDANRVDYELTLDREDGQPVIASLLITPHDGAVDQDRLRRVPTSWLAAAAATHLADLDADYDDGMTLRQAIESASGSRSRRPPGRPRKGSAKRPTLAEFVEKYRSVDPKILTGNVSMTRRELLADAYEVSPVTIDRWTRAARDQGLLPKITTKRGRPRKNEAPRSTAKTGKKNTK